MIWYKQDVNETFEGVPVHIGAQDLLTLAYLHVQPSFLRWSQDYPSLSIVDCTLRSAQWADLTPADPSRDSDVIAKSFFVADRKNSQRMVFKNKPGGIQVYLQIHDGKYQAILKHKRTVEKEQRRKEMADRACVGGEEPRVSK